MAPLPPPGGVGIFLDGANDMVVGEATLYSVDLLIKITQYVPEK